MKIVTIDDIKRHLRIEHACEDDVLELYGDSAEQTTLQMLGRSYDDLLWEYGEIPTPVRHAVLMLAAHSYNQRELSSPANIYSVPYTYDALIKPYMNL